jgi:hypothetical protein
MGSRITPERFTKPCAAKGWVGAVEGSLAPIGSELVLSSPIGNPIGVVSDHNS